MKLVGLVREQTYVSLVPVSEYEIKTVTRGISYKFTILNSLKINTSWENCHHFPLAYQNLTKPADLERGDTRLPHVGFSDSDGMKYHSFIRWNFSQLNSLKIKVFKESDVMEF